MIRATRGALISTSATSWHCVIGCSEPATAQHRVRQVSAGEETRCAAAPRLPNCFWAASPATQGLTPARAPASPCILHGPVSSAASGREARPLPVHNVHNVCGCSTRRPTPLQPRRRRHRRQRRLFTPGACSRFLSRAQSPLRTDGCNRASHGSAGDVPVSLLGRSRMLSHRLV